MKLSYNLHWFSCFCMHFIYCQVCFNLREHKTNFPLHDVTTFRWRPMCIRKTTYSTTIYYYVFIMLYKGKLSGKFDNELLLGRSMAWSSEVYYRFEHNIKMADVSYLHTNQWNKILSSKNSSISFINCINNYGRLVDSIAIQETRRLLYF